MLVELNNVLDWLKANANRYIVDVATSRFEEKLIVGGKCWDDLKNAMPEAGHPKIKARLLCEGAEVEGCNEELAETIREEIDYTEIGLDYIPAKGEQITFFNRLGWYNLTVQYRDAAFATEDANVKDEYKGCGWNNIVISKIEIMELNKKSDKENK